MIKKQSGNRVVDLTKHKLNLIKENDDKRKRILDLESMNLALTNENTELEGKVKHWESMQEKGYTWVNTNPDTKLIIDAGTVLPSSRFTFTQEIPTEIGTALYKKIPYYELDSNGKMCINTAQKIKYNTGGLL